MGRTQEERKAETRARLLDAAARLFAERGVHAVSAEALTDAADRTTGALYAHFGGKEGLLLALLEQWRAEALARLGPELDAAEDLDGQLQALWREFAPGDQQLLEHELWLYGARNPDVAPALAERFGDDRAKLALGVRTWRAEADVHDDLTAAQAATLVLGLLLGLAMQRRLDPTAVPDTLALDGMRRLLQLD